MGSSQGPQTTKHGPTTLPDDLIGSPNETYITMDDKTVRALIDTGSQVSTVAQSYVEQHHKGEIFPINDILRVDDASGKSMPYKGYVICDVNLLPGESGCATTVPMLVVPDTEYHKTVPVLIGVSVIRSLRDSAREVAGECFLQKLNVPGAVALGVRAVQLQERHLSRSKGVISEIKVFQRETIPAHSSLVIAGKTKILMDMPDTYAVIEDAADKENYPVGVSVSPCVVRVHRQTAGVLVDVVNNTDHAVELQTGAIIGKLHQASVVKPQSTETPSSEFIARFDLSHLSQLETDGNITGEQIGLVNKFLEENKAVFCDGEFDVGHQTILKHRIDLTDETPIKQRCRFIPPHIYDDLQRHLQQLLELGIIAESDSPWSQNLVYARKKDGSLRICQDFRALNARTIKDAYEIPRVDDLLNVVRNMKWVTSIDISWSYWNTEIEPSHRSRTAFTVGSLGHFQWNRMAFGLTCAPSTQQKLMSRILKPYLMRCCVVYVDDVLIFSNSFEQHLKDVENVMKCIAKAGLKLKPEKCKFFKKSVEFLGHIVCEEGIRTNPSYVSAVQEYPVPTCVKDVERFLGLCGYYRRFIQSYSTIAKPLLQLLEGRQTRRTKESKKKAAAMPFTWGESQDAAFNELKSCLTSAPVLRYPDFTKPFLLRTDASGVALGAVLLQEGDESSGKRNNYHVVAYASRSLRKGERGYSAYKLEFKALHWAITVKFKEFLVHQPFVVTTDHNPLTYLLTSAKLDATTVRWVGDLAGFTFEIRYKRGILNRDADVLSRIDWNGQVSNQDFKSLCEGILDSEVHQVSVSQILVASQQTCEVTFPSSDDQVDWVKEQSTDPHIKRVRHFISTGSHPTAAELVKENQVVRTLMREPDRLEMRDGVLYRRRADDLQLVLPEQCRGKLFKMLHWDSGHLGRDKTLGLFQERVYWPGMVADVGRMVASCERCKVANAPHCPAGAPLVSIQTTTPMELVCIDFLTLDKCKGNIEDVLVITDHFTRYAQAIPTPNQNAASIAKALYESFFVHYGFPQRLHSDQGKAFCGRVISELCKLVGTQKSRTTPYHAQGNGQVEKFNQTLISMLRSLPSESKTNWKAHVSSMCHAYNSTIHQSTGYSPFFLMFGRKPRLAADVFLGLSKASNGYNKSIQDSLREAYEAAVEASARAGDRSKVRYDFRKARGAVPVSGDRVLVRRKHFTERHKLVDHFEPGVHVVVDRPNEDIPVYRVKPENGQGKTRVLHRNLLLPLALPLINYSKVSDGDGSGDKSNGVSSGTSGNQSKKPVKKNSVVPQTVQRDEESDGEGDLDVHVTVTQSEPQPTKPVSYSVDDSNPTNPVPYTDGGVADDNGGDVADNSADDNADDNLARSPISGGDADNVAVTTDDQPTIAYGDDESTIAYEETNDSFHSADSIPEDDNQEVVSSEDEDQPVLRRSGRDRKPPSRYDSYYMQQHTVEPKLESWEKKIKFLMAHKEIFDGNPILLQNTLRDVILNK